MRRSAFSCCNSTIIYLFVCLIDPTDYFYLHSSCSRDVVYDGVSTKIQIEFDPSLLNVNSLNSVSSSHTFSPEGYKFPVSQDNSLDVYPRVVLWKYFFISPNTNSHRQMEHDCSPYPPFLGSSDDFNPFLETVSDLRTDLQSIAVRNLTEAEISKLRSRQNKSLIHNNVSSIGIDPTWNNVRMMITDNSETFANEGLDTITDCFFLESVVLAPQTGACSYEVGDVKITMPCGVSKTTLRNVTIYPNSCIFNNTLIEHTVILPGSIVMGCGRITCTRTISFSICIKWATLQIEGTQYGNGTEINMGNETGGIKISITADLKYNDLKNVTRTGVFTPSFLHQYL